MFIRLALITVFFAFAGLAAATVMDAFLFNNLATTLLQLSVVLLLAGFAIFFSLGLGLLASLSIRATTAYFSAHRRLERRFLFYQNTRRRLERLHRLKTARVLYLNRVERRNLLRKIDKKTFFL